MWAFIMSKENPNVCLLLGLPWLQSVDAKLFIQKKEIHIRNTKKGETVSSIPCSTTVSEGTQFQTSKKEKIVVDKSSEKEDTKDNVGDNSSEKKLDKEPSIQDFYNVLVMTLKVVPNLRSKLMLTQLLPSIIYA